MPKLSLYLPKSRQSYRMLDDIDEISEELGVAKNFLLWKILHYAWNKGVPHKVADLIKREVEDGTYRKIYILQTSRKKTKTSQASN